MNMADVRNRLNGIIAGNPEDTAWTVSGRHLLALVNQAIEEERKLFIKYMHYVGVCEGTYFLPKEGSSSFFTSEFFTPEEIQTLNTIAYEADALDKE